MNIDIELIHHLAKLLIGSLFIFSGLFNIHRKEILVGVLVERNIPLPHICINLGMLTALCGGVLILLNIKLVLASILLSGFVVTASIIFHDFWNKTGHERDMKIISFMNNIALLGAIFLACEY